MGLTHIVKAGRKPDLKEIEPGATPGYDREEAARKLGELGQELCELQELMYAAGQHGLLVVLQGRDTAGKDGAIRSLLNFMNAQGTTIAPFKVPTPKELSHDFLWRCHSMTPGKGECTIFNRSHYEDVLVVRVHELAPESVWRKRYEHINAFERLLTDSNIVVVKFMLHISMEEQAERLREREMEVEKSWKLSVNDWKERDFWAKYTDAYEDALGKCSTDAAPWHVVPANHKWFRDLAVTHTLVEALRPLKKGWMEHLELVGRTAKAELEAYRASKTESRAKTD